MLILCATMLPHISLPQSCLILCDANLIFLLLFFPYRKPGGWTADERRRRLPRVAAARGPEDALDLPFATETPQLSGFSEALTRFFFLLCAIVVGELVYHHNQGI